MNHPERYFDRPTLSGHGFRLEPLGMTHENGLRAAAADGELWNLRVTSVPEPQNTAAYIQSALTMHAEKKRVPFAVIEEATGRVLGSTSYHDLLPECGRLEIGYTWYAKSMQRSNLNTSSKLLLMSHAFDELGAELVGWRTDIFNHRSQRAIERLGATREAVLRMQGMRRDGTVRDTVIYGMPASDWPDAKAKLVARLSSGAKPRATLDLRFVPFAELDAESANQLARLDAGAGSTRFVALNGVSITNHIKCPYSQLIAIMNGSEPVGMMLVIDPSLNPDLSKQAGEAPDALYLWRLMVAFKYQGQGIGQLALQELVKMAQRRPLLAQLRLSHGPHEGNPGPLYERFGFTYTGEIDGIERVMTMNIPT